MCSGIYDAFQLAEEDDVVQKTINESTALLSSIGNINNVSDDIKMFVGQAIETMKNIVNIQNLLNELRDILIT